MHTEISFVLVQDHRRRLRDAATAPTPPFLARLWALLLRRQEPTRVVTLSLHELERLAA